MYILSIIALLFATVAIQSLWMFIVVQYIHLNEITVTNVIFYNVKIVISMIFSHLIEASVFALFYLSVSAFNDWETSFYFSLVSYATIGYGDVLLPENWRLIGAVEGIAGSLMLGWSVAMLVAILQRIKGLMKTGSTDIQWLS